MQVVYYRLFDKLKARGIMQKTLAKDLSLSESTMQRLRRDENVTTEAIGKICEYLQCQPNDIMEVIPDENIEEIERQREKQALEAQIAELQAKLKNM